MEIIQNPNQPQKLDLQTDEWTERFASAPIFEKTARVRIRPAVPGEQIKTVLANGTEETVKTAGDNDVVITNPTGEEYIVDAEKAASRYKPTEEDGVFQAIGTSRILPNPTGGPIEITAPWGEPQFGDADCLLASLYDTNQPEVISTDRYIIGGEEFRQTFGPLSPSSPEQQQP
jgi:hypothetical protein